MKFRNLLKYAGKYKAPLLLCPVVMIGEVTMEMLIPQVIATLIDTAIPNCKVSGSVAEVIRYGLLMVLMAIVSMGFGMAGSRLSSVGGMGFAKNLREAIFSKVQTFSFKNIDKFSTASLITRLTTDVNQTQNVVTMLVRMGFRSPVMFIMAIVMAVTISPSVCVVLLVALPVLALGIALIMKSAYPKFRIMMEKYDSLNASIQENLIAIRVVKAFVRSDFEKKKFGAAADDVTSSQQKAERIVLFNSPLMQVVMYSSIVAVLWFGGKQVVAGTLGLGQLVSLITYITTILSSLMMLSFLFLGIVMSRASISRICEVLEEQPDIANPENAEMTVPSGEIEFINAGFSYQGDQNNLVLQNINLHIKSGETIGLIGGTGSAKTTLVSLLPRLYDLTCGELKIGGKDIRSYDIHALRDQVAMVLQKNVLFSGSIKDNLRWGDQNATDEEIIAACKTASADGFVTSLPGGYDMDLGQGGVNVSGGQKQRLCIARALLKKPKIMVLDDATSAVDTATDASIRAALKNTMPETTKIIIAQRITSVMDADRIIVLNDGQISDVGTHEELLQRSEIYREVYESQQKGVA